MLREKNFTQRWKRRGLHTKKEQSSSRPDEAKNQNDRTANSQPGKQQQQQFSTAPLAPILAVRRRNTMTATQTSGLQTTTAQFLTQQTITITTTTTTTTTTIFVTVIFGQNQHHNQHHHHPPNLFVLKTPFVLKNQITATTTI